MIKATEYKRNFRPLAVPGPLAKLLELQNSLGDYLSSGFELRCDDKSGLTSYSDKPAFLGRLHPIGQANASGSTYALWSAESAKHLDDAPVVVFGDEGGIHVVAENLLGLLRLLTLDGEPMIDWDSVSYYKADDAEPSGGAARFVAVLKKLKLVPVKNAKEADKIVKAAQTKHRTPFQKWLKQYYTG